MIDTHSHLYLPDYGEDKCAAVDRALAVGVSLMILPGVDVDTIAPIRELHALRPEATAMCVGLHPTDVKPDSWSDQLTRIVSEAQNHSDYVAIGETGLDLYWEQDTLPLQLEAFDAQLDLADSQNLPAIIHCRNAMPQMLDLLVSKRGRLPHMVFHCYSGTADDIDALRRIQAEVMFGIGGVVTFKKSPLPALLKHIGINHILLETDAPWLAPTPMRGKRNESSYIPYIAAKIAEEMQMHVDEVDLITTKSAKSFFKLH